MKILFYNPALAHLKFTPFNPIKGNPFFLRPNYDAMRLTHLSSTHEFIYYDERIEEKPDIRPDLLVVHVPLTHGSLFAQSIKEKWPKPPPTVLFGTYPTLFPREAGRTGAAVASGDIAAVWPRILDDVQRKKLGRSYSSRTAGTFAIRRGAEMKPGYTGIFSQIRTSFGCHCAETQRDYCTEAAMYRQPAHWPLDEAVREITRVKRKAISIIDDDFLFDRDYAVNLLERTWRYKKMWVFQTRPHLFDEPKLLPILQDNGVRIITIKGDWLSEGLTKKIDDRSFLKYIKHQIDMIHNYRMAIGTVLRLGYDGEDIAFYKRLDKFLNALRLDFVEFAVQTPLPGTPLHKKYRRQNMIITDPALYDLWSPIVKTGTLSPKVLYELMETARDNFYAFDSILRRGMIVSQKLGVYNSLFFFLIPNLSYRNNFLEKVGFPP